MNLNFNNNSMEENKKKRSNLPTEVVKRLKEEGYTPSEEITDDQLFHYNMARKAFDSCPEVAHSLIRDELIKSSTDLLTTKSKGSNLRKLYKAIGGNTKKLIEDLELAINLAFKDAKNNPVTENEWRREKA